MSSETHHLEPHTVKKFFGKLLVLNDTDHRLIVEAVQVDTNEGQKFTLNIKTPEPLQEATATPEPLQEATATPEPLQEATATPEPEQVATA